MNQSKKAKPTAVARNLVPSNLQRTAQQIIKSVSTPPAPKPRPKAPSSSVSDATRRMVTAVTPETRKYLASLANPFDLEYSPGVPGTPSETAALSRRYSCFSRFTMATVPGTSGATGSFPNEAYCANEGFVYVSPKLFGLNTSDPTINTANYAINTDGSQNFEGNVSCYHTILQHPVVYTSPDSGVSASSNPGIPANTFVHNNVTVSSAQYVPSDPTFTIGKGPQIVEAPSPPNSSYYSSSMLNVQFADSNSDIQWDAVLPQDIMYSGVTITRGILQNQSGTDPPTSLVPTATNGAPLYAAPEDPRTAFGDVARGKIRLVSFGMRIRYMGAELNRGGRIVGLRHPTGDTLAAGMYGGVVSSSFFQPEGSGENPITCSQMQIPGLVSWLPLTCVANAGLVSGSGTFENNIANDMKYPSTSTGNFTFNRLLEFDEARTEPVNRDWVTLIWTPVDEDDVSFEHLYETCSGTLSGTTGLVAVGQLGADGEAVNPELETNRWTFCGNLGASRMDHDWGYSMGFRVQGVPGSAGTQVSEQYEVEIVGHYEVIGEITRGKQPTVPADPTVMSALLSVTPSTLQASAMSPTRMLHSVLSTGAGQSFSPIPRHLTSVPHAKARQEVTNHGKSIASGVSGVVKDVVGFVKGAKDVFDEVAGPVGELLGFLGL